MSITTSSIKIGQTRLRVPQSVIDKGLERKSGPGYINSEQETDYNVLDNHSPLNQEVIDKKNEIVDQAEDYAEVLDVDLDQITITDLSNYNSEENPEGEIGGLYDPMMDPDGIYLDKKWVAEGGEKLDRGLKEELSHMWQYEKAKEYDFNAEEWAAINDLIEGQVAYWLGDDLENGKVHPEEKELYQEVVEGEVDLNDYLDSQVNPLEPDKVDYNKINDYLEETHNELGEKSEELELNYELESSSEISML